MSLFFMFLTVLCGTGAYISHRYHLVNGNKTWIEAQAYCRQKYTDMATINNMEEINKLNDTLTKETAIQAWIGLNKQEPSQWWWSFASENFYKDDDTYRNWASGQPNNNGGIEFCVQMVVTSGVWHDYPCNSTSYFVCYDGKMFWINFN